MGETPPSFDRLARGRIALTMPTHPISVHHPEQPFSQVAIPGNWRKLPTTCAHFLPSLVVSWKDFRPVATKPDIRARAGGPALPRTCLGSLASSPERLIKAPSAAQKPQRGSVTIYASNFETFLNEQKPGQPWAFWYGTTEPHRGYEYGSGVRQQEAEPDRSSAYYRPECATPAMTCWTTPLRSNIMTIIWNAF